MDFLLNPIPKCRQKKSQLHLHMNTAGLNPHLALGAAPVEPHDITVPLALHVILLGQAPSQAVCGGDRLFMIELMMTGYFDSRHAVWYPHFSLNSGRSAAQNACGQRKLAMIPQG